MLAKAEIKRINFTIALPVCIIKLDYSCSTQQNSYAWKRLDDLATPTLTRLWTSHPYGRVRPSKMSRDL